MTTLAALVVGGCASDKPAGIVQGNDLPLTETLRPQLGTVSVAFDSHPAAFGFDPAQGQIETAGDLAGSAAHGFLTLPSLGDSLLDTAVGAVGFALAPAAAIQGAFGARERLAPEQLSQCQSNLTQAMSAMAQPQHFRNWILQAAAEKTRRRLLPAESLVQRPGHSAPIDAVLETHTEQLRLVRTGSADTSFALRIQTRVRLVRVRDRAILYEQPLEYRSGPCLFLDWTMPGVFQSVADTGYRLLAERVVHQLFVATPEGPLLVGAGYKPQARRLPLPVLLAARAVPPSSRLPPSHWSVR